VDGRYHLGEQGVDGILMLKYNLNGEKIEVPGHDLSGPGLEKLADSRQQVMTIPILYNLASEHTDTFLIPLLQDLKCEYELNETIRQQIWLKFKVEDNKVIYLSHKILCC
jgi:hypothetical protein